MFNEINFYASFYVVLFILFIYWLKPNVLFKPNGKPREYGFGIDNEGYKKTLYNLHFIIILIIIIILKIILINY